MTDPVNATVNATDAAESAEELAQGLRRLERELGVARRHGARVPRQLHRLLTAEIRRAERRAEEAERRAEVAEAKLAKMRKRAKAAERELAEVRSSTTWKAGRAITAVPGRLKRRG